MNVVEAHALLPVNQSGHGEASIAPELFARARRHAVKLVPIINHLEQWPPIVFARCPELRAVGDPKAWERIGAVRPVCFSQPRAQQILNDWFTCLAKYPDVTDIMVWLSENDVPCECDKCKAINPFVLQTRVVLHAWEAGKKVNPKLRLRILLTQGSYKSNDQVLAAVPPEVGITYYDGSRTYNSSRKPMIYPLMENFAAQGRWLGCYPQLTSSWRLVCPWSGPQFMKARMTEFVDKRLRCLCGYAPPANRFCEFTVTAAAEWSWNAHGRSEHEFSLAWAMRQGLSDPEKAADWAVMLGPVGWDVYGGKVPFQWVYGSAAAIVKAGKRPTLGKGIFTYFPTVEHMDHDLAVCDRAMRLAQEVKSPKLVEETRVVRGLVQMIKGLYLLGDAVSAGKRMTADDRQRASAAMSLADEGHRHACDRMLAWEKSLDAPSPDSPTALPGKVGESASFIQRAMADISDAVSALGIADPHRAYRLRRIGQWTTEDFAAGPSQRKTWDVSKTVSEAGRYRVAFQYDRGWYGIGIKRVALVSTPADDPTQQTEVACDKHDGATSHRPKKSTYELVLGQYDAHRRYFVVADIVGIPRNSPTGHSGCYGHADMQKVDESAEK